MNKRSGFQVMRRLIGLVRPLTGYMLLAIAMGLIGHLCAAFITVAGGLAAASVLGFSAVPALSAIFFAALLFALLRGGLRLLQSEHQDGENAGAFTQPDEDQRAVRAADVLFGIRKRILRGSL